MPYEDDKWVPWTEQELAEDEARAILKRFNIIPNPVLVTELGDALARWYNCGKQYALKVED